MLQGLVIRSFEERISSVDSESCLLREIEEARTSHWHVTKMTEAKHYNQNFIVPWENIYKKETETSMGIESKRENGRRKAFEALYNTDTRST